MSYSSSLSRSIWEVNTSQIVSTIEGMIKLPDVIKVSVMEDAEGGGELDRILLAETGEIAGVDYLQKSMPIMIDNRGKETKIGTLVIFISLESLYQDLYGTVVFILIFQMFKTCTSIYHLVLKFHFVKLQI